MVRDAYDGNARGCIFAHLTYIVTKVFYRICGYIASLDLTCQCYFECLNILQIH